MQYPRSKTFFAQSVLAAASHAMRSEAFSAALAMLCSSFVARWRGVRRRSGAIPCCGRQRQRQSEAVAVQQVKKYFTSMK